MLRADTRSSISLVHFTPMPPSRNGIADYAYAMIESLSRTYRSAVLTDDPFATAPPGVVIGDPVQAFRFLGGGGCPVYQVGNNWGHKGIYEEALETPGVVVLHDAKLLYLVEALGLAGHELAQRLVRSNPRLAPARAADIAFRNRRNRSDYMLFDMTRELLERSRAVVVHSHFARWLIGRHLGSRLAEKVHVIPHFAFRAPTLERAATRQRLALETDDFVIVTCGFATKAKRYDWLLEALDRLAASRRKITWVQAGPIRAEEYDLEAIIDKLPRVRSITRLTGYIREDDLAGYLAASDVVVNLRFPSVGESSGILSRALPAGACCVVVDTAAYRELPDDAVVKISAGRPVADLSSALLALMDAPDVRHSIGENARAYARDVLSLERYTGSLGEVIEAAMSRPASAASPSERSAAQVAVRQVISCDDARRRALELRRPGEWMHLRIGPLDEEALAGSAVNALIPDSIIVESARIVAESARAGPGAQAGDAAYLDVEGVVA